MNKYGKININDLLEVLPEFYNYLGYRNMGTADKLSEFIDFILVKQYEEKNKEDNKEMGRL